MSSFALAIKSTLDKLGYALGQAQSPVVGVYDLDDVTRVDEMMKNTGLAIVWELLTFGEDPANPFYSFTMHYGCKAVNSPANYSLLALYDKVVELFPLEANFPIKDASGAVEGAQIGYIHVISIDANPQLFDKTTGFRLATIHCRACRSG